MEQEAKQVPYGVSDFERVMTQNMYYVDKTMNLPMLEKQPSYLFFIRPRRFGKSIFLSMLHSYYDCDTTEGKRNLQGFFMAYINLNDLRQGTTPHRIIMQFKGWELVRMEEV